MTKIKIIFDLVSKDNNKNCLLQKLSTKRKTRGRKLVWLVEEHKKYEQIVYVIFTEKELFVNNILFIFLSVAKVIGRNITQKISLKNVKN